MVRWLYALAALVLCVDAATAQVVWNIDNLASIDGHAVSARNALPIATTQNGIKVLQFDGIDDGILVAGNPISAMTQWTLEFYFYPASGGGAQQRYFHANEATGTNRMLFELRSNGATWYLDTFENRSIGSLTLIDATKLHSHNQWYHLAAVYDGIRLKAYVNRTLETSGTLAAMPPLVGGTTSLGARNDPRDYFKGSIAWLKATPRPLTPDEFTTPGTPVKRTGIPAKHWLNFASGKTSKPFIIARLRP